MTPYRQRDMLVSPTASCFFHPQSLCRGIIIYNIVETSSTGVGVKEAGVLVGVHAEDGSQVSAGRLEGAERGAFVGCSGLSRCSGGLLERDR